MESKRGSLPSSAAEFGWRVVVALPFLAFFVALYFTEYHLFGVADALMGIPFLFFAQTIVEEPGLSFENYLRRVFWFVVMAFCASVAGLHPLLMALATPLYLFFVTVANSDDYLPQNYFWLGMGYLILLVYPVGPAEIPARLLSALLSAGFATAFIYTMRWVLARTGHLDVFVRDRSFVRRSFDDVGQRLEQLAKAGLEPEPAATLGHASVDPHESFRIAREYAELEYGTVFRQNGLLSGRQSYTFALLLCCEQVADLAHAASRNREHFTDAERSYYHDLSHVFTAYGEGRIGTVSAMVAELRQFIDSHQLPVACHEEAWSGILEATVRTLEDTGMSRDTSTPLAKGLRYRVRYLRENVNLRNTQTRFALRLAIIIGLCMLANILVTHYFGALFGIWIPITAFAVLNTYNDETMLATKDNFVGTMIGVLAFALFIHFVPEPIRAFLVVSLSYFLVLIDLGKRYNVAATTQMALVALYPHATLGSTMLSRLLLVILAVTCVMLVVFALLRTRRSATVRTKVQEMERIDVRLRGLIRDGIERGHVNMWRTVQLLYYLHLEAGLLERLARKLRKGVDEGAGSIKNVARSRQRRQAKNERRIAEDRELAADVERVLQMNYQFAMDAAHAVMLLDPRRAEGELPQQDEAMNPDTTGRLRHIDATAERLEDKMAKLEEMQYLEGD
jgi:hypothetical protein